jgi:glucosamine 6-phosphate synthetase-like amidotransferase/phosphosugar isomerase protein
MSKEFVYHFWCYNPSTGTIYAPNSVEVDICADSEDEAFEAVKEAVKDRGTYALMWVKDKATMLLISSDKDKPL